MHLMHVGFYFQMLIFNFIFRYFENWSEPLSLKINSHVNATGKIIYINFLELEEILKRQLNH